jgi:hypothetical protein
VIRGVSEDVEGESLLLGVEKERAASDGKTSHFSQHRYFAKNIEAAAIWPMVISYISGILPKLQ